MPAFVAAMPASYRELPTAERAARAWLGTDDCVIDQARFFVLGLLELPVHGVAERFAWGVWVELGEGDYLAWRRSFMDMWRAAIGPFDGTLDTELDPYPSSRGQQVRLHLRDEGVRPSVEVVAAGSELGSDQSAGLSRGRAVELCTAMLHPAGQPAGQRDG